MKELTDVLDTLVEAGAVEALAPAKGAAGRPRRPVIGLPGSRLAPPNRCKVAVLRGGLFRSN